MPKMLLPPRGAITKLRRADPALSRLMRRIGPFRLEVGRAESDLAALVSSIIYQQLSGKAAATIYQRFRGLFAKERFPLPEEIQSSSDERLRAAGLSRQKISYLRDLCARIIARELPLDVLPSLPDEEVVAHLTKVRGFGRWSAEMFLIFHLGRLDVWPVDDLGIRKGVAQLHGHDELPRRTLMEATGELYRPYRTIASWYFWRSQG